MTRFAVYQDSQTKRLHTVDVSNIKPPKFLDPMAETTRRFNELGIKQGFQLIWADTAEEAIKKVHDKANKKPLFSEKDIEFIISSRMLSGGHPDVQKPDGSTGRY